MSIAIANDVLWAGLQSMALVKIDIDTGKVKTYIIELIELLLSR